MEPEAWARTPLSVPSFFSNESDRGWRLWRLSWRPFRNRLRRCYLGGLLKRWWPKVPWYLRRNTGYELSGFPVVCVHMHVRFKWGLWRSFRVSFVFSLTCLNMTIVWLETVAFWGPLVSFNPEHPSVTKPTGYLKDTLVVKESGVCWLTVPDSVVLPVCSYCNRSMRRNWKGERGRLTELSCFVLHSA